MNTWLLEKLHNWETEEKERKSEAEFADYLGVGKKALNHWMNGRNNPSYQSALKLAEKTDDYEIFDLLNYPYPSNRNVTDEQLAPIAALILQFPKELRPQIRSAITEALKVMTEDDKTPTEKETLKLLAEKILSEINKKSIEKND